MVKGEADVAGEVAGTAIDQAGTAARSMAIARSMPSAVVATQVKIGTSLRV
jgi:hypothetical protein